MRVGDMVPGARIVVLPLARRPHRLLGLIMQGWDLHLTVIFFWSSLCDCRFCEARSVLTTTDCRKRTLSCWGDI